jgi:hypothetical protein
VDVHALWDNARFNKSLVSIVLAPEKKTSPAFCLTDHGLPELEKCQGKGFHRHNDAESYYMEANHAIDDQTIATVIEDFRIQRQY